MSDLWRHNHWQVTGIQQNNEITEKYSTLICYILHAIVIKKKMYTIIYTNFGRGYKNMFLPSVWRSLVSHLKVDRIINLWRRIRRCHWKCCFDAWIYYSVWALTYLISEINKLCLCDSVSADLLAQQPPLLYWQNIIDLTLQGQTRYTIRSKLSR